MGIPPKQADLQRESTEPPLHLYIQGYITMTDKGISAAANDLVATTDAALGCAWTMTIATGTLAAAIYLYDAPIIIPLTGAWYVIMLRHSLALIKQRNAVLDCLRLLKRLGDGD